MQIGLKQQAAPQFLGENRGLHMPEAHPTELFGYRRRQPAHIGELSPHLGRETTLPDNFLALGEGITLFHVAPGTLLQHALLITQIEIHAIPLKDQTVPWR
ncbi:hypothetical protein D3C85_788590 [compost metagenome]